MASGYVRATLAGVPATSHGPRRPIEIAPSVLPVDFSRLGDEVAALEAAGVDRIQWDVMDGQFVPNLTFGPAVIAVGPAAHDAAVRGPPDGADARRDGGRVRRGRVPAADRPRRGVPAPAPHARQHRVARRHGGRRAQPGDAGIAVAHVLDLVDMVLVMTVNPGFGGQPYIADDGAEDPRGARR